MLGLQLSTTMGERNGEACGGINNLDHVVIAATSGIFSPRVYNLLTLSDPYCYNLLNLSNPTVVFSRKLWDQVTVQSVPCRSHALLL